MSTGGAPGGGGGSGGVDPVAVSEAPHRPQNRLEGSTGAWHCGHVADMVAGGVGGGGAGGAPIDIGYRAPGGFDAGAGGELWGGGGVPVEYSKADAGGRLRHAARSPSRFCSIASWRLRQ